MRSVRALPLAALAGALASCTQDPFGSPVRPTTHGYRAHVAIRDARGAIEGELAARGEDLRFEPAGPRPTLVLRPREKKLITIDPRTRTWSEGPLPEPWPILAGYPLKPGFDDHAESRRRDIESYHRESDAVFAGHVCWIWRFEDRPDDPASPSTTYWVAPDLDRLVVRVIREAPRPDGSFETLTTDLTNVRVGADADLFQPPKGYRAAPATPTTRVAPP